MQRKFLLTAGLAAVLTVATVGFPRAAQEPVDTASVEKIKAIGLDPNSSKVMEIASYLTDVYGPRLTGSANIKKAGDWSVERMKEWGLTGAALEPWPADPSGQNGGFPCGWTNDKFYLAATLPQASVPAELRPAADQRPGQVLQPRPAARQPPGFSHHRLRARARWDRAEADSPCDRAVRASTASLAR